MIIMAGQGRSCSDSLFGFLCIVAQTLLPRLMKSLPCHSFISWLSQRRPHVFFILLTGALVIPVHATTIEQSSAHPFYWEVDGAPTLLLGGTADDNLFQIEHLHEHLRALKATGGNVIRCTLSSRDEGNVKPYATDGAGLFDLQEFNPGYWNRLSQLLAWTAELGIIVQVEIWATYDFYWGDYGWASNPFNPTANRTYSADQSGLPQVIDHPAQTAVNPFFESVPALGNNVFLLEFQQQFVDKVLSLTLPYDHVLYCIDNETSVHYAWGEYWAAYLQNAAGMAGKRILVTEMWDSWDPSEGKVEGALMQSPDLGGWFAEHTNPDLHIVSNFRFSLERPDLYAFLEVSNHNAQRGQTHYETAIWVRSQVIDSGILRPINNTKIYGGDLDQIWAGSRDDGRDRFWRNIFAGHASARFHRPPTGMGFDPDAQMNLHSARSLTDSVHLFTMEPANALLGEREADEAYCLVQPDHREVLLYFPSGGEVYLDLKAGDYTLQGIDVGSAVWQPTEKQALPGTIKAPSLKPWAAVLRRR